MISMYMRKNEAGEVTGYVVEANGYPLTVDWVEAACVLTGINKGQKAAQKAYDRVLARRIGSATGTRRA
jgi:hypothetical protein